MSGTLHEYLWIAIAGGIFGFVYTFSIGANDVANAFVRSPLNTYLVTFTLRPCPHLDTLLYCISFSQATSVASKSVTLPQAVAIAAIFEFCGVLFLGASVTSTVRGKIFNAADYEDQPEIVLLGMFTSLVSASFMMMMATYMGKL